jgi:hypothetical protein
MRKPVKALLVAFVALLVAAVVVVVLANRVRLDRFTGYYAPTFTPDGGAVVLLERQVTGISWGLGYEHFTVPAHSYVLADELKLRSIDLESGTARDLEVLPELPTVGRHLRAYRGRLYHYLSADLRFSHTSVPDIRLKLSIPRVPTSEQYNFSRLLGADAGESTAGWREGGMPVYPSSAQRVYDTLELLTVPGAEALPCGVVLYDHANQAHRYIAGAAACARAHPDGYAETKLLERSQYAAVKRIETLRTVRQQLMEKFRAQGMIEGDAAIATIDEMRRLGFYPKPTTIEATPLDEEGKARYLAREWRSFKISDQEFLVGLFQDIERALDRPGEEVEFFGRYTRHRDFDNSEALNAYLKDRPEGFLLEAGGRTYAMTIDWR